MLPLIRPCSLFPNETAVFSLEFGMYIVYEFVLSLGAVVDKWNPEKIDRLLLSHGWQSRSMFCLFHFGQELNQPHKWSL